MVPYPGHRRLLGETKGGNTKGHSGLIMTQALAAMLDEFEIIMTPLHGLIFGIEPWPSPRRSFGVTKGGGHSGQTIQHRFDRDTILEILH